MSSFSKQRFTYQPGEIRAIAYRNGEVVAEDVIQTTGQACRILLEPDRTEIAADGMDLCYVTATLVDKDGHRVYDSDCELCASVSGNGTLAGFGSNNPCTDENFGTGHRFTWDGWATMVMRSTEKAGPIELIVTADGYPAATLTICSK